MDEFAASRSRQAAQRKSPGRWHSRDDFRRFPTAAPIGRPHPEPSSLRGCTEARSATSPPSFHGPRLRRSRTCRGWRRIFVLPLRARQETGSSFEPKLKEEQGRKQRQRQQQQQQRPVIIATLLFVHGNRLSPDSTRVSSSSRCCGNQNRGEQVRSLTCDTPYLVCLTCRLAATRLDAYALVHLYQRS